MYVRLFVRSLTYLNKKDSCNQMQSEMADFTPVPPTGELDELYMSSLLLVLPSIIWKYENQKYITYCIAEYRATATGNMLRTIWWNLDISVFETCDRSDRQTRSSQYFAPLSKASNNVIN